MAKRLRPGEQEGGTKDRNKPSDLIDRQLARYREMRDFQRTREPSGGERPGRAEAGTPSRELPFVIQKHAATRLHYDLRLGLHGVLKSWAVAKGPSYVPEDKRLAVQVEDHPIEYGGFEGAIPKGQYGGGTVMLWDEGTWEPVGDPDEGLAKGNLKFVLHGKKLRGQWVLIRMHSSRAGEAKPNWLLIKEHDRYERGPEDPLITEESPDSVATRRSLDAIAHDEDHVWQSNRPEKATGGEAPKKKTEPRAHPPAVSITHPGRIIDRETGLTKQDLVDYYLAVAERMLPHIAGRPLSLVRCPDGSAGPCFFQKHFDPSMPRAVEGIKVPDKSGKGFVLYVTISTADALAGLAQMNVLEIHPWGSTNADLEHPDRLIFDLDPDDTVSWCTLGDSAREVRERLGRVGLKSFLKTTGGKGLHVVSPIRPDRGWDEIQAFAHAFALAMEKGNNKLYISRMAKAARKNKILIDYRRNERGATAVAPYSPRARAGLTAALPLAWSSLGAAQRPRFPIADFANWKGMLRRDPWKAMTGLDQPLPPPVRSSSFSSGV